MIIQNHVHGKYYKGLYRNRPLAANFAHLAFEAWHLGMGAGVLIGRLIQFLLAMVSVTVWWPLLAYREGWIYLTLSSLLHFDPVLFVKRHSGLDA